MEVFTIIANEVIGLSATECTLIQFSYNPEQIRDPETVLRNAVKDYLKTDEGKRQLEINCGCWNWGDVDDIPKKFPEMSDEWLDFIAICRSGKHHDYDIVEGPMADDTIWNYVNDFLSGDISREAFWALAKFKHPTHQISFHTEVALKCLSFKEAIEV